MQGGGQKGRRRRWLLSWLGIEPIQAKAGMQGEHVGLLRQPASTKPEEQNTCRPLSLSHIRCLVHEHPRQLI